jgi:GT2 family glycosyltransferase
VNIDLLVLGYGHFELTTKKCLDSILPQLEESRVKVYVLDNGSPDDSALKQKIFCSNYPQIESLYSDINLGFAGGMNYLAEKSNSDWLMLVGSDTIFYKNALNRLQYAIKKVPDNIGIIGPVTNSAGTAQCLEALGENVTEVFARAKDIFDEPSELFLPLYRADFFCVMIRRAIWKKLNGLDRVYGLGYYEDFDFSMRADKLGFQSIMVTDALVFHQGSASFKKSPDQKQLIKKNKKIFLKKFPYAKMLHIREDLHLSIEKLFQKNPPSQVLDSRNIAILAKHLKLRIDSLALNKPKGFFKKLLWQRRVNILKIKFDSWQKSILME